MSLCWSFIFCLLVVPAFSDCQNSDSRTFNPTPTEGYVILHLFGFENITEAENIVYGQITTAKITVGYTGPSTIRWDASETMYTVDIRLPEFSTCQSDYECASNSCVSSSCSSDPVSASNCCPNTVCATDPLPSVQPIITSPSGTTTLPPGTDVPYGITPPGTNVPSGITPPGTSSIFGPPSSANSFRVFGAQHALFSLAALASTTEDYRLFSPFLFLSGLFSTAVADITCSNVTIDLPSSLQGNVVIIQDPDNPLHWIVIINNLPNLFCGKNLNQIGPFLDPPDMVQEFISVTFGAQFGVSKLNDSSNAACANLANLLGSNYYVIAAVNTLDDTLLGKLVDGNHADKQKANRRKTSQRPVVSKLDKFKTFVKDDVEPFLPICMAIAPCIDANGGVTFDFGVTSTPGFPILNVPVTLGISTIAFSSTGKLLPLTLSPVLLAIPFDTYTNALSQSPNMDLYLELTISFPLSSVAGGVKKVIGNVEITGQLGISITFPNKPAAALIGQLSDCNGVDPQTFANGIQSQGITSAGSFQLTGNMAAIIELELGVITGTSLPALSISRSVSGLIGFTFDPNSQANTFVEARYSDMYGVDTAGFVSSMVSSFGEFGNMISSLFPGVSLARHFAAKLTLSGEASLQVALVGSLTANPDCGPLQTIMNDFNLAITPFLPIAGSIGIQLHDKFVTPCTAAINAICPSVSGTTLYGAALAFTNNQYDRLNTWIMVVNTQYTLDIFPTCPPPLTIGGKCSVDSDCTGSEYNGGSGFCKFDSYYKTSIGCVGTCINKLNPGDDCTWSTLNYFDADPGKLEEQTSNPGATCPQAACSSGTFSCGSCTSGSGNALIGTKCSSNSDCSSGWCDGSVTAGCMGTCGPKLADGQNCGYPGGFDAHCSSGKCNCGTCGYVLPDGSKCSSNSDCSSGWCDGSVTAGCMGTCGAKLADGQNCGYPGGFDAHCSSGKCNCGTCGYVVPNGAACSSSSDCSGSCNCGCVFGVCIHECPACIGTCG